MDFKWLCWVSALALLSFRAGLLSFRAGLLGFRAGLLSFRGSWYFCTFFVLFCVEFVYFNEPSGGVCISPSKKGGLYFTAVRHKPTRSREHKPPTHITTGTPRQKQAGIGEYRPPHNRSEQHQAPMQAQVLAQDGGGANEAAGGCPTRNGRARFERGVRGCCKSVVLPDRPARCVAVSCHVVGFVFGCGQFSRIVSQSEGGWV